MLESTASGTVDIKNRLYSETEHMRIYSKIKKRQIKCFTKYSQPLLQSLLFSPTSGEEMLKLTAVHFYRV